MDDKFIYYLVIGAIYLVSRMLKKKKPPTPVAPSQDYDNDAEEYEAPTQQPASPKPSSFEELLREISQEFDNKKEPKVTTVPITTPIEPIETSPPKDEFTREQKYVNKKKAEAKVEVERKHLIRLADEENEHEPHAVLELLNEEGGAANAVVLSEILNRRY